MCQDRLNHVRLECAGLRGPHVSGHMQGPVADHPQQPVALQGGFLGDPWLKIKEVRRVGGCLGGVQARRACDLISDLSPWGWYPCL